jgi:hypothetical protein
MTVVEKMEVAMFAALLIVVLPTILVAAQLLLP